MKKLKMPKGEWPRGSRIKRLGEVYSAQDGWRWRIWSKNGRIIAESGEAYQSKYRCTTMLLDMTYGFGCTFVVDGKLS